LKNLFKSYEGNKKTENRKEEIAEQKKGIKGPGQPFGPVWRSSPTAHLVLPEAVSSPSLLHADKWDPPDSSTINLQPLLLTGNLAVEFAL
jgi:hypothetical protein